MKKLVVLIALLAFAVSFNAQSKMKLGIGLNANLPSGTFGDVAGTGIGGTAQLELGLTDQITGVATVGYITYGKKDLLGIGSYTYSCIPVAAGVKYHLANGFYGIADVGLYSFTADVEVSFGGFTSTASESSSEFGIGVGAGYCMPLGDKMGLDITAKYLVISDMNSIDIRAGVKFPL